MPIFAFVRVKFPSEDSHLRSFTPPDIQIELQRRTADFRPKIVKKPAHF